MNQYYLTEWLSNTNATDIPIHIYTMPLEEDNKHSAGGNNAFYLSKLNLYQTVIFYEQYIASFKKIKEWDNQKYIKYEHRVINPDLPYECKLLERLIKKEIENKARKNYIIDRGAIRLKKNKPLKSKELLVYPAIYLSITINSKGKIIVGFEYKHRFEYSKSLMQLIKEKSQIISKGISVIDSTNPKSHEYKFKEIASYTANQESPYLKESIINYYKRKNKVYKLKNISDNSMVVHVENNNGDIFPYLPQLLKLSCSFETLPPHLINIASKAIKEAPGTKMPKLLRETYNLLQLMPILEFPKTNVLVGNLGYEIKYANNPSLKFGNEIINKSINSGLLRGGVYSGKEAKISFFVDPVFHKNARKQIAQFIKILESESHKLGVKLNISSKPRALRGQLDNKLFNSHDIALQLKDLPNYYEGTVVVLTTESNSTNSYKAIKKEFGGKQDIITQFIMFNDSLLDIHKSRYKILNILLGIYVKSGIQPWILAEKLYSDCFIGLDVSHEEGKHASGIIQVIGHDGRIIKQKSMGTNEAGERISCETMEDIIYDSIHSYEVVYGKKPQHITFHRDGFCRENLDKLSKLLTALGIKFDYIEVLKNVNRRMAVYENNKWTTHQSLYYKKDKEGFLCSTSPREFVGMAKPIKIVQKTSYLQFDEIVSDIYKLSFMHIHSMLKTRLPITTHYADLSSTFHNRGLLHPRSNHELALPFV